MGSEKPAAAAAAADGSRVLIRGRARPPRFVLCPRFTLLLIFSLSRDLTNFIIIFIIYRLLIFPTDRRYYEISYIIIAVFLPRDETAIEFLYRYIFPVYRFDVYAARRKRILFRREKTQTAYALG